MSNTLAQPITVMRGSETRSASSLVITDNVIVCCRALQEIFRTQLSLRNVMKSLLELVQRGDKDETVITTKIVVVSREFLSFSQ